MSHRIICATGIIHAAEEKDWKTAYSYFFEAFEGYDSIDSPRAITALKYMLLCKIVLNSWVQTHRSAVYLFLHYTYMEMLISLLDQRKFRPSLVANWLYDTPDDRHVKSSLCLNLHTSLHLCPGDVLKGFVGFSFSVWSFWKRMSFVSFSVLHCWILGMMLQGIYIFSPSLFNYQTDALKCVAQASKNRSLADFEKVRTQWAHMRPNVNMLSNVLFRNIYPVWPDIYIYYRCPYSVYCQLSADRDISIFRKATLNISK